MIVKEVTPYYDKTKFDVSAYDVRLILKPDEFHTLLGKRWVTADEAGTAVKKDEEKSGAV